MKTPFLFLSALALMAAPFFTGSSLACAKCEARTAATQDRPVFDDPVIPDVVLDNHLDIKTEPTLRDEVRLNAMDIRYEPTLRDEIRLNCMDINVEPTLRDTIRTDGANPNPSDITPTN